MGRRILPRLVAGIAVLALAAAGCGRSGGGEDEAGSSFSMQGCEPQHMIPGNSNELCGIQMLRYLFTGLVDFDPKTSEPVNMMARSIESDDQKVWTIEIKKGWEFHNGQEVTADSYIDAWNAAAYAPNAWANNYFFENIQGYDDLNPENGKPKAKKMSGLKKLGRHEFQVTLTAPFSQFPITLGYTGFSPLPKVAFEDLDKFEEHPVGNGPYQMDGDWQHNRQITLKKFGGYKGSNEGNVDQILYKIYNNPDTAYNDLLAGNLDQAQPPVSKLKNAEQQFGDRYIQPPISQFQHLDFPLYDKRFQDKDLRHAFSLAINRKQIIDKIFNGMHQPAKSVVSPVVGGARDNPCNYCEYDPKRAKQLFGKAGGFDDTLVLWYNTDGDHEAWMNAVANQLRNNLGIEKITFKQQPFNQFLTSQTEKKMTGPFRNSWLMDYPSIQNYLEPVYASDGSSNRTYYNNPEVDRLIDKGNRQPSVEKGFEYYYKAEDIVLEDMPVIPLWFHRSPQAWSENITNVQIDPFGIIRLSDVRMVN